MSGHDRADDACLGSRLRDIVIGADVASMGNGEYDRAMSIPLVWFPSSLISVV